MGGAALVTGGARRVGKSIAVALARRGMDVAIHYRNSRDDAQRTVEQLTELGVNAVAVQADFQDENATRSLVDRARETLARDMTVLINNASVFEPDHIATATREGWDRHMESNLRAPFVLIQELSRQAPPPVTDSSGEKTASACVINLVDHRVVRPMPDFATYTISKMALWALTQTAAIALAPYVRVNAIGPGPTLRASRQSSEHFANQRLSAPLCRGPGTGEVAAAVVYFLDSPSVTGQLLCLEGGQNLV